MPLLQFYYPPACQFSQSLLIFFLHLLLSSVTATSLARQKFYHAAELFSCNEFLLRGERIIFRLLFFFFPIPSPLPSLLLPSLLLSSLYSIPRSRTQAEIFFRSLLSLSRVRDVENSLRRRCHLFLPLYRIAAPPLSFLFRTESFSLFYVVCATIKGGKRGKEERGERKRTSRTFFSLTQPHFNRYVRDFKVMRNRRLTRREKANKRYTFFQIKSLVSNNINGVWS